MSSCTHCTYNEVHLFCYIQYKHIYFTISSIPYNEATLHNYVYLHLWSGGRHNWKFYNWKFPVLYCIYAVWHNFVKNWWYRHVTLSLPLFICAHVSLKLPKISSLMYKWRNKNQETNMNNMVVWFGLVIYLILISLFNLKLTGQSLISLKIAHSQNTLATIAQELSLVYSSC